ncbi:MAG: permease [Syntrophobacteraceae bacterium]
MKTIQEKSCACNGGCSIGTPVSINMAGPSGSRVMTAKYILVGIPMLVAWWLIYGRLEPFAGWLAHHFAQYLSRYDLSAGNIERLRSATEFFVFEGPKVLMLLLLVVFGVGVIRSFFTPERTRKILAGKRESVGNVLAALLGIVTPFCSCSAVPLFIGFVTASVPLGVTFSFLISSPMVNEVALVLLYGLFGWRIAAIYMSTGLIIAMLAGWTIGRLKMERHLEDWVYKIQVGESGVYDEERKSFADRIQFGLEAVRDIVGKVWIYVLLGIAVGAGIHGYVPTGYLASIMGKGVWWSVPVAVLIAIPIYSNAAGIIPVVSALIEKGAAMGTVLAFMMAVVAISFPETVILRKVLKPRLILVFTCVVAVGCIIVGYLFNLLI